MMMVINSLMICENSNFNWKNYPTQNWREIFIGVKCDQHIKRPSHKILDILEIGNFQKLGPLNPHTYWLLGPLLKMGHILGWPRIKGLMYQSSKAILSLGWEVWFKRMDPWPFEGTWWTNCYTRLEILAWSHSVFIQFSLCIKRRFMIPLLLSRIENYKLPNLKYRMSFYPIHSPTSHCISNNLHVTYLQISVKNSQISHQIFVSGLIFEKDC